MKKLCRSLIVILLFSCSSHSPDSGRATDIEWIQFKWKSDSLNGRLLEKAAMYIPVRLDTIPEKYYMQFDLGLDVSVFYEKPFLTVLKKYPILNSKIETDTSGYVWLRDIQLLMDDRPARTRDYILFKDFGNSESDLIGSVGAAELKNRVLIIDFRNQKLGITDRLSADAGKDFEMVKCEILKNRIFIPCTINGRKYRFMFDTGTSLTPLLTTREIYEASVSNRKQDTIQAGSWGEAVKITGALSKHGIRLGDKIRLKKNIFYTTDHEKIIDFFKREEIDGMIGNPYFFDEVIMIDFKDGYFGVKKKS